MDSKRSWSKGYCTEAGLAIVQFGFEQLALSKICSFYMSRNSSLGKVLKRLGLEKEKRLKKNIIKWGVAEDVIKVELSSGACRDNSKNSTC